MEKLPPEDRPGLVTSVHGFYSVNRYSAIMSRGEGVIAVSNCIRDYILTHYPSTPEDHIRIIPNAISPDQHHPDYSPSREWLTGWHMSYPELKGKFTLCLPGRITRLKGQLDLIPIVRQLLERGIPAHAVIVGETKRERKNIKTKSSGKLSGPASPTPSPGPATARTCGTSFPLVPSLFP